MNKSFVVENLGMIRIRKKSRGRDIRQSKNISSSCVFIFLITIFISKQVLFAGSQVIDQIVAGDDKISIILDTAIKGKVLLELPSYESYNKEKKFPILWRGNCSNKIEIDRFGVNYDRIYSKFLLVDSETYESSGDAVYVTEISDPNRRTFPLPRPKGKKGLTCVVDINDAIDLGVKYINDNINMNEILDLNNSRPQSLFNYEGFEIPINMSYIKTIDQKIKRFTDAGIAVFVVLLNKKPVNFPESPLIHPNTDINNTPSGILAFNLEDEKACRYYRAALEFLANRYTRPDKKYGQISSLIIGNELQQHWVWYNMGLSDEDTVLDNYHRAVRLAWLATQKYHSDIRIYISMEHHWTQRSDPMREIRGDVLLNKLSTLSKRQGDFPWNVAFHPYPEDLFEPRFWLDQNVTNDFSTPKITFKNIEVLPQFMKQPSMLCHDHIRDIALTEQGFHTPDGPEGEKVQAAAYAYSFYKVNRLPEISAYTLHRHVDHRNEGGLRLGLWTADPNSDLPSKPLKKKYIWKVFKYADTAQWKEYFEFAKPIIGIHEWGDRPCKSGPVRKSIFTIDKDSIVYDFIKQFKPAQKDNNLQCEQKDILRAAGWMVPAIFQHPPMKGKGKLIYWVDLPRIDKDAELRMLFETMLNHKSEDGVRFSICIDGAEIWSTVGMEKAPKSHEIDLTKWSGQKVNICFEVDKINNLNYDWSYWVNPIITVE